MFNEVIKLPEGWIVTRLESRRTSGEVMKIDDWTRRDIPQMIFLHKCNENESMCGRIQKNTHRRHGVRYICNRCKAVAPGQVVVHYKLNKLGTKL